MSQTTLKKQTTKEPYDPDKGIKELADTLISLMEKDINPFRREWSPEADHLNFTTGEYYQNGNLITLEIYKLAQGHKLPYWAGFKQAQKWGCKIKKGSKSAIILRPITISTTKPLDESKPDGLQVETGHSFTIFRPTRVFNIGCFEGSTPENQKKLDDRISELQEKHKADNHQPLDDRLKNVHDVVVTNYIDKHLKDFSNTGNEAFYDTVFDCISVPDISRFSNNENYYSVVCHEACHSTGSQERLKRDGIVKQCGFGSALYAEEEIITECAAFLLCRELKIGTTDDQHASYLKSWCSKLRKEPKFINTILGQAVKAKNFILNPPKLDISDNT